MKFDQANILLQLLSLKELKAKHLSGDSYFNILCLRKKIKEHIDIIAEGEQNLAQEFNAKVEKGFYVCWQEQTEEEKKNNKPLVRNEDFFIKLSSIRKDFETNTLNFIPKDDFKKWIDELDINSSDLLAEHLLAKDSPSQ